MGLSVMKIATREGVEDCLPYLRMVVTERHAAGAREAIDEPPPAAVAEAGALPLHGHDRQVAGIRRGSRFRSTESVLSAWGEHEFGTHARCERPQSKAV